MFRTIALVPTACLALSALAMPTHAEAQSLSSCGDIYVEARAECTLVPPGAQCEAQCEPINVEAACAARLAVECEGECQASASVDCQASCQADCRADCQVDPGAFSCRAECQADCSGSCEAHCEASGDRAHCEAACRGSCSAGCDADCNVELPEVDCEAKCEASCSGSCEAQANIDCQVDCQADLSANCEVEVTGGCKAECETMEGALFCNGQYVDHGGNLEECVDALKAAFDVEVEGYAEGSSSCANGTCMAEGEAGASCSALPTHSGAGALGLLGLPLVALLRRRRR